MRCADDAEVAIAGGGPAGSIAALVLARAGRRVTVVERWPMPRDKVCGDLLGTEAVRRLRRLRAAETVLYGAFALSGAVLHTPGGRRPGARKPGPVDAATAARVIPRRIFDAALLEEAASAGASVVTARVTGVLRDRRGVVAGLQTSAGEIRAQVTIGADGWGSQVTRALGTRKLPAANTAIVARAYVTGVPHLDCRMHFFVKAAGEGYGWIFPLGGGQANVGLGFICSEPGAGDLRLAFGRFCGEASPAAPYLSGAAVGAVATWPIPLGWAGPAPAAPGALIAGDAAALASPLSGSGIHHALASGEAAARSALRTLNGDAAAWQHYARFLSWRFAPRLVLESRLHRIAATAAHVDRWSAVFARLPGANQLLSQAMLSLG